MSPKVVGGNSDGSQTTDLQRVSTSGDQRPIQQWQQSHPRRTPATEAGQVINMLTVEGREQVLLKVSVVEMERNIIKQFGVDLGALINSGQFRLRRA